jgi:hypothetical protein
MKALKTSIGQLGFILLAVLAATTIMISCGGGGGDGNGDGPPDNSDDRASDAQALESAPLTKGGSVRFESTDGDEDGAMLIVPSGAVDQDTTLSIAPSSGQPTNSPWGQSPIGSLFEIGPSGLDFDPDAKAQLTLPLSPGGVNENLYIGRWNETTGEWERLGGTITGDFISTELDHLSLYGVFPKGRSLVRILNDVAPDEDPNDQGIDIFFISGPAPPPDWPEGEPFPAQRPLPDDVIRLHIGEDRILALSPGHYHFAVSFPSPFQVTNNLFVIIPELVEGAAHTGLDQTITITGDGASSDDAITDASLNNFPGNRIVLGANLRPQSTCTAVAPQGVPVTNNETGADGLPSRRILVGPILVETLRDTGVEFTGMATDPEGGSIRHVWTMPLIRPSLDGSASGGWVSYDYSPNSIREGRYDVYLTSYDAFNLFDQCHWEIIVRGNEKPTIEVIANDFIVDFGRLGSDREQNSSDAIDRNPLPDPAPQGPFGWCQHAFDLINGDGVLDTTELRALPILPPTDINHIRPTQYSPGMTCLYALVGDADGDPLTVNFRFPFVGDLYNAITGEKITTTQQLDDYNTLLTARMAEFPVPEVLAPYSPEAQFAPPIIWEAPDNVVSTLPGITTHDCRHYPVGSTTGGPCYHTRDYPAGGVAAIVATVTDGFSREQMGDFGVGYGEDDIVVLGDDDGDDNGDGSATNTPPTCSDDSVTTDMGQSVVVPLSAHDPDGDPLTFTIISGPTSGYVDLAGATYTPDGSFSGVDSFTFVANDGIADSEVCTIEITINEVRKSHVFKLSGVGYNKRWGGFAEKGTGYEYFHMWILPSEADGIVGTDIDNTGACEAGPWAGPVLTPSIWETREVVLIGVFDTWEEMEPYRCDVPNWAGDRMLCNGWTIDSDPRYWDDINRICGGGD